MIPGDLYKIYSITSAFMPPAEASIRDGEPYCVCAMYVQSRNSAMFGSVHTFHVRDQLMEFPSDFYSFEKIEVEYV